LTRRQLGILEELLVWRDQEAKRRDLPHFKVLGNNTLLQLATQSISGLQSLQGIEGLSPRLADRYGSALLQAVEQGNALEEAELPLYPRGERREKDPAAEKRFMQLKGWRQQAAKELELDPGVLINNATLELVARSNPRDEEALKALGVLKVWQLEELGAGMLRAI
jgi:ribonuclease D